MSYEQREHSVASGAPFECYHFATPVGTFRYTSLPVPVQLGSGAGGALELYTPQLIKRGSAEISTIIDSLRTMDIHVPIDDPLAKAYCRRAVPAWLTTIVYRAHLGDDLATQFDVEWRGEATGYSYDPDGALIVATQSILQAKVQGPAATPYVQLACNHRVFDSRCKALRENFTHQTVIATVDNVEIRVESQGFANSDLALGTMVNVRTGEVRSIHDNIDGLVTITYPFLDVLAGDQVELTLGCDNTMATCVTRFDNVANFGGFRYVPLDNLFVGNGDKTVKTTTTYRQQVIKGIPPESGRSV